MAAANEAARGGRRRAVPGRVRRRQPLRSRDPRPTEVVSAREGLPILGAEQEIVDAVNSNPLVVLCGETGCGKTTQVPQFLFERW